MSDTALPDSAWGPTLLCCVTVFLLGTGSAKPGVIQSPRHLIKARGGRSMLKCIPISGHDRVSWYQQTLGQELRFLIQHYQEMEGEKGSIPSRFSVQQFSDYHSEMNMSALQLEDSAVYFCASSSQPYRVTGFLSPIFLCQLVMYYGGVGTCCTAALAVAQECINSILGPSAHLSSDGVLNTIEDSMTPDVGTCPPVPSSSLPVAGTLVWVGCLGVVISYMFHSKEPMEAAVTQSPRSKVTATGGKVELSCHQTFNHNNMYWYRQDPGHGLRLIHYSFGAGTTEKGDVPDGYKASRPSQANFSLALEMASPSQTAVYFCASSDAQQFVAASSLHIK